MNIMMDWNFFAVDPWQKDTYAPLYGAREKNAGANAQGFCDSTLRFALPASTGKPFVDRIWSAGVSRSYWDGSLYMLALLHMSGMSISTTDRPLVFVPVPPWCLLARISHQHSGY